VRLGLYIDVDRDAALGTNDRMVALFNLVDGQTNSLAAETIVDDEDGAADGAIASRVSYFGIDGVHHVAGSYLWAASTNGLRP